MHEHSLVLGSVTWNKPHMSGDEVANSHSLEGFFFARMYGHYG